MDPWVWAILLLALGMGLAVLEVFFPSAGILGFLAVSSIIAAVIMGFRQGPGWGMSILGVAIVGIPVLIVVAFKVWPHTAIGRKVLLMAPSSRDVLPSEQRVQRLKSYVGRVAVTKCKMLPAGAIVIDGRTVDAISEGMPLEEGQAVRIIEVRANRVVVRPTDEEPPQPEAQDPLRRPIEQIAADPFDEPPVDNPGPTA